MKPHGARGRRRLGIKEGQQETSHNVATTSTLRLWDLGQRHLAAGRYIAARQALEGAEAIAWRSGDLQSLARLYLPLLEARRLIRYQAAEGRLVVDVESDPLSLNGCLKEFLFLAGEAGTLLVSGSVPWAAAACREVRRASQRTGGRFEALIVHRQGGAAHLASPSEKTSAAGIPIVWTSDTSAAVGASTDPALTIPLPPPDVYEGSKGLGAMARESLIIAWEALALRWQRRHPLTRRAGPWEELAWLRRTLWIDPACEPVAMRLMSVAEAILRQGGTK